MARWLSRSWVRWILLLAFLFCVNRALALVQKLPSPWSLLVPIALLLSLFGWAAFVDIRARGADETPLQALRRVWTRTGLVLLVLVPILAVPVVVVLVIKGPPTFAWR